MFIFHKEILRAEKLVR